MTERNLCTESGCKAFCCRDPIIHFAEISDEDLLRFWPTAKKTRSLVITDIFARDGVYYERVGKGVDIKIKGYCPNIDADFNCKLQSAKPEPCANFGLGRKDCTFARLDHLLVPYGEWDCQQSLAMAKTEGD